MRLVVLMLCSWTLSGCDSDQPGSKPDPGRRTEAVTASATGAPGVKQPMRQAERPERAPAPTMLRTAKPPASGTASAAASTTASAGAAAPEGILGALAKAARVKVTHISTSGESQKGVIHDGTVVKPLLEAIGLKQTPTDGCERCMPSVTFTFEDGYGTRLGSLGTFCTEGGLKDTVATLHDPLGNKCQTITLITPKALETLAKRAIADAAAQPSR